MFYIPTSPCCYFWLTVLLKCIYTKLIMFQIYLDVLSECVTELYFIHILSLQEIIKYKKGDVLVQSFYFIILCWILTFLESNQSESVMQCTAVLRFHVHGHLGCAGCNDLLPWVEHSYMKVLYLLQCFDSQFAGSLSLHLQSACIQIFPSSALRSDLETGGGGGSALFFFQLYHAITEV